MRTILIFALCVLFLSCDDPSFQRYKAAKLARVGQRIDPCLKFDLVEENENWTKYNPSLDYYITCHNDTIIAIWRPQH